MERTTIEQQISEIEDHMQLPEVLDLFTHDHQLQEETLQFLHAQHDLDHEVVDTPPAPGEAL